ncbi:MAG: sulfotransferase domain-containing protein [Nocardioidaceae bacterium]
MGARAAGRATSSARMEPSFLIVGAQRCGTTSMFKTLRQHPAVLAPALQKGIHYFDKNYDRGPGWYRSHFPLRASAARAEGKVGVVPVTGESSPYYMFHPLAAERIAHDLPRVRLVVLVRDPVERALSAYTHEKARGYETETFERALELEPERIAGEAERMRADVTYDSFYLQHNAYLTRGQYVEQLERLERLVGRDRIHVVDSQEFFERPAPAFAEVLEFLGLPAFDGAVFEQHNARPRSPMDPDLAARLDEHFRLYDERLEEWLGRPPGWRR